MSTYRGTSWKGYLIDHHWPRAEYIPLNRLSIADYEEQIRLAAIDHLVVYCKDHWGSCYYPTRLGVRHPSVSIDYVGEMGAMLRRIGAEFTAYYSVGFDEHAARSHPEWVARDPGGEMLRHPKPITRPRWHRLCLETGYMDFLLRHLAEILSLYDPDSVFLDILGHPPGTFFGSYLCYCDGCRGLFRGRYGHDLPPDAGGLRARAFEVEDFRAHLDLKWFRAIRGVIRELRPEAAITINASAHFRKPLRDLVDHHFTEPFWGHWRSSIFMRGVGRGKSPQGTGQVPSEVYDPSPRDLYRAFAAKHWAQGIRPLVYSPSQRPDGRLDRAELKGMAAGYADGEALREFLDNRSSLPCVGVLYHERTCVELPDRPYGAARPASEHVIEFDKGKPDNTHRRLVGAAIELVSCAQTPVDVLTEEDISFSDLRRYPLLVIGGASRIDEEEAEEVARYVANGGSLVLSCDTGLRRRDGRPRDDFVLADLMGLHFDGIDERFLNNRYGSYVARRRCPLWRGLPDTDLPLPPPLYRVTTDGADVLAYHAEPCAAVGADTFVSWWSPAPARKTRQPLVTHHRVGQGRVVYFAANPFIDSISWLRRGFVNLIDWLLDPPPIRVRTSAPRSLGSSFWRRNDREEIVVHLVNLGIEALEGEVLPIKGARIEVAAGFGAIRSARLVHPKRRDLRVWDRGQGQAVSLPPIDVHSVVVLELDGEQAQAN